MNHKLEVVFNREFTLSEVETLKDALYEFLQEYEVNMNIELCNNLDLVVLDAK